MTDRKCKNCEWGRVRENAGNDPRFLLCYESQ